MTRAQVKELLLAVKDGHHSFKEILQDLTMIEQGMVVAIASLATALNNLNPEDPIELPASSDERN